MAGPLNSLGVRYTRLNQGKITTESDAQFWGNVTKGVPNSTKGVLTVDSGCQVSFGTFKASKDSTRRDVIFVLYLIRM